MLAVELGHHVTAGDLRANHRTAALEKRGVAVYLGHDTTHVDGVDEVVISGGVPTDNPVVTAARRAGKPVLGRTEALAELLRGSRVLSVVGSFGKSTTTALAGAALRSIDPTMYMGADATDAICGVRVGSGPDSIVETCEYRDEMLCMSPSALLMTGLWENHEDWFGPGTDGVVEAFSRLIDSRDPELLVACSDSPAVADLLEQAAGSTEAVTFGVDASADYRVTGHSPSDDGVAFELRPPEGEAIHAWSPVPGEHGAVNAAGALTLAMTQGVEPRTAARDLARAAVPYRRFEWRIRDNRLDLVDDNARLPAQIATSLRTARELRPGRRLVAVCGFWGRLNARNLPATARSLRAADVVLPFELGGNATSAGGAERDDSISRLAELLGADGVQCEEYSEKALLDGVDEGLPACVITLGYDGELDRFRQVEDVLRRYLGRPG